MEFASIDYILIIITSIVALIDVVLMAIRTIPSKSHSNDAVGEISNCEKDITSNVKE